MPEKTTKNLGIRTDLEKWRRLAQLALDRQTSVQALVMEAVDRVYFGVGDPPPPPHKKEPDIFRKLREFWDIAAPNDKAFLEGNVDVFLRDALRQPQSPKRKHA